MRERKKEKTQDCLQAVPQSVIQQFCAKGSKIASPLSPATYLYSIGWQVTSLRTNGAVFERAPHIGHCGALGACQLGVCWCVRVCACVCAAFDEATRYRSSTAALPLPPSFKISSALFPLFLRPILPHRRPFLLCKQPCVCACVSGTICFSFCCLTLRPGSGKNMEFDHHQPAVTSRRHL